MLRSLALAALVFGLVALHQLDPAGLLAASDPPRLLFGLPLALAYHLAYCFVAAAGLTLALRLAWPAALLASAEAATTDAAATAGDSEPPGGATSEGRAPLRRTAAPGASR